ETGVTANTTANMKADEKNGMRVYLADQNNNYVSVDVDFGDTSVSGSPSATEIAAAALADTGITATGVDLTKLKEYMANNAAKVGGNATDLLDTMNLDDLQFETLAYSAISGTKKFIGTNVNNSDIAKIVDVEASNSANQDTNIVGTYINSIVAKPVKFIDVNYNTSAASETTDANGKLLGNKATVTVDFSEIANKIAAREAEMAANPAAGLKSIVFDINEIEIAGRNLQIGRRFDDATGNVSETDGTAFTLEDRIQAFKDAITADNYTNWITSNGGSQATSSVNNFEKFTLKEVAENKFEITVHNVAIGDDDTSDLNSIVAVKMTAADGGAATAPTASSAGIYNNTASEGFTKTDLYVSVDKIESSRVYSLNDFLNSEQFSHIVFDPLKTEQTTFSQKLNGNFVNTDISLKAGINGERNSAKFTVILDNGNEYESNDVYLSGNGGVGSNGYKVAGGTEITLSRVGGDKNEVGLSFVVQDSGLDFNQNASNINDMNTNINTMTKSFTSALVDGNVGIQVVAPAKFVKDVGIQSLDQFTFSGNYDNQSHLTGDLKLQSKAGLTAAQGYIQINNLKTGDILNINGKKVTIGTDVMTNTGNMRDALLKYLFESKDSNLSKANYTGIGSDKIVVSSREKGIAGNAIFMSVENINSSGSVTINNEEFTAAKANLNTTRYLGDAHDVLYVKSGTESSSLDMQYLPSDMIGGISDISGKFISGNSQIIDGVHNANSIDISITIGGQKLNGNVALNGGSVASGSAIGAGYLGVGNIVSKDTVLELTDSNKSFSLSITLGDDLLLDGSTAADNQVKLDKYLGEMLAGTKGLSVYQERSISGFNASKVVGTALSALTPQSVTYNSDKYDSDGNAGGLNRFEYDNANKTLSAKIDGSVHKVVLNDSMAAKGFGEHFDSTANKIVGGKGAIMKLHDENSSSYLALNLESISSIDLSSTLAIDMFLKVLNDAFSSNSSGGIKYQVGAHDSLSAYLPNLSMDALLGVNWNSINVSDVASAIDSFNKINDVVDKTNIYQTQVSSDLSAMSRALENNLTSYEAMSEAYDDLIKMPFYESSALYAAAEMTTKAAASALQKINQLSGRIFDSLNQ
ncbi:MAG: hypothetical protein OEY79_02565, partial [Anaplasmataceae bacterium]|nr:hypothetical protein [Anaplasmataceae bacterium]